MSGRRRLLVKDVFNPDRMCSLVVDEGETVSSMIKTFADQPNLRGIFVVDKEKRFKGVITRRDLLNWARIQLGIGVDNRGISRAARVSEIISEIVRVAYATTAKELVRKYSYRVHVNPEDSLISALNIMFFSDLIDIPVIDKQGKIIGDLKLNEILNEIIKMVHSSKA